LWYKAPIAHGATPASNPVKFNFFNCVARFSNNAGNTMGNGADPIATGTTNASVVEITDKAWWCSSGRLNNSTSTATIV
jgi:hypothetical protein